MEIIVTFAIGIVLLYVAIRFRLNTQKIAKKGIETEGVVFDIVPSKNIDSKANYPLIRFVTSEKEWITEEYNISAMFGFFKKGQKVTIVYNPDNTREFVVKSPITSVVPILVMILGILILATGIYKLIHI